MTNLKRRIGYLALVIGLVSTPTYAQEDINKAVTNEVTNSNDERQIDCLAKNIYREAGGESIKGKFAVASVVMNRAKSDKFPSTPCAVIYQRSKRGCQFTWVCSGGGAYNSALLKESRRIAEVVYYEKPKDETNGALYFHAKSVKPKWSKRKKLAIIGRHIFY